MSSSGTFTAREQIEALYRLAEELQEDDVGVLALGSAAVILKTGQRSTTTKDLDLHVFPVEDILALHDTIEQAIDRLGGTMAWEPDGATITAHVPVGGREISVEIVFGRDQFIHPEVLEDAVETAEEREGVLVPSWEHIVAMKAEAWFDRTGRQQDKYLADLRSIREWMDEQDGGLSESEVRRLVELRPERKRREMMLTVGRVFEGRMA